STFQFFNNVDFRLTARKRLFVGSSTSVIAEDPVKWFDYLRKGNCTGLRYRYQHSKDEFSIADHYLAGMVGGGGEWLMEALYDSKSAIWNSFWDAENPDRPDNKIWRVSYMTAGEQITQFK